MRRLVIAAAVIGLIAGVAIAHLVFQPAASAQRPEQGAKWEYKVVAFRGANNSKVIEGESQKFNDLSGEGWEYVGPISNYSKTYANGDVESFGFVAFRRPKK